jgi:hypothetical protein
MKCTNTNSKNIFTDLLGIKRRTKTSDTVGQFFATNRDGLVKVISVAQARSVLVKFVNSGFEKEVLIANLRKGKCMDETTTDRTHPTTYPNKEYESNGSGRFTVVEKTGSLCTIVFKDTGYKTTSLLGNLKAGKVNDPYRKSVYGIGYLGEYTKNDCTKYTYILWHNMLKRCYCPKDSKGYFGRGIEVSERWLCYSNFIEDVKSLTNFDKWLDGQTDKTKTQYNLDKDFAFYGCILYSKENCQFMDESINKGTTSRTIAAKSRIEKYNRNKENQNG